MKTFAITLLISAFLVLSNANSCSDAYAFADMSINSLRNNFVSDLYTNMFEDFENVMKSAELIKDSCPESVNFMIEKNQIHTCSLAYITLSKILDGYGFQRDAETVSTLSQIMSLIPSIDEMYCLDEWEMIALENIDNFDDGIWADYDSTHDYGYDKSDDYNPNYLIEDEEEEKTGDEVYPYSDDDDEEIEEIEPAHIWPGAEMQDNGRDIQANYDEEREDEDDDLEYYGDDENDSDVDQEIDEQEDDSIMVFVDPTKELTLLAEVEEDITIENAPVSKEDEEMIMVFVAMTNMANTGNTEDLLYGEEEEESLSIYANTSISNGEESFEAENEDGSVFVYVDLNNALGINEVVNVLFAENQDDEEVEVGELDLKQYWDDDGDDYQL